jgi:predicted N-acetyltransferase YhbS
MGERISLNYPSQISIRWNPLATGHVPGFVWEESGDIVGNVTLLETEISGRFIIANVAVHPDHQRQGIARALMYESLSYIEQKNGQIVLLQVERNNQGAINLYRSLGFFALGTMNLWYSSPAQLKLKSLTPATEPPLRRLGRNDWKNAFELDRQVVNPELNWPVPPSPNLFKTGIWRRILDFLNGQKFEGWLVEKKADSIEKHQLFGMVTLFSSWGRPTQLRLRVDPGWQGELEHALLFQALKKVKRQGIGSLSVSHPANDTHVNDLLSSAGFRLRRELTIMAYQSDQEK